MEEENESALLEYLREISKNLQNISFFTSNNSVIAAVKPLLDLDIKADSIVFNNPYLSNLSQLLRSLRNLVESLDKFQGYGVKSVLRRPIINYKISQTAYAIEAEIQAFMDRESIRNLVRKLKESDDQEEEKVRLLTEFVNRVSDGFDRGFQDLILKGRVFPTLESLICDCDDRCSKRVRENAAMAVSALASFNKNVFVGLVLMGETIEALISMESSVSIEVLSSLVNLIRSPLIDEIHCKGQIPKIMNLLSSEDFSIQIATVECICQIAYFGRRDVIGDMLAHGLINKLMEIQRRRKVPENCRITDCIVRFAVLLEVGEGLSRLEKRELKLEVLERVRKASVSETEAAAIVAEVLWGSSP